MICALAFFTFCSQLCGQDAGATDAAPPAESAGPVVTTHASPSEDPNDALQIDQSDGNEPSLPGSGNRPSLASTENQHEPGTEPGAASIASQVRPDDRVPSSRGSIATSLSSAQTARDPDDESVASSSEAEIVGDHPPSPVPTHSSEPDSADNGAAHGAWLNLRLNILLGVVLASLAIASIVGQYLTRQPSEYVNPALVRRFRQRVNAWWLMCAILVFGLLLQSTGTVVLFGLVSFWALREFITMTPTRRGDHRALFWALIVFTPLQYVLIGLEGYQWRNGQEIDSYGLYSIMIPVYASLFVPARIAIAGDFKRFLERSAQITIGLLICVYSLSYAPALINLKLTNSDGTVWTGSPAGLLFFFVLVSQLSDILQWSWGHLVGHRIIAEEISTSRTWEGFAGGTLSTGLIGAALSWVTPFTFFEAACMSMVVGVMGMFGGMTMSAIKRDRGVNDYGSLVLGHAGVLDRIDTICFAAPVFYHLTRFFFT